MCRYTPWEWSASCISPLARRRNEQQVEFGENRTDTIDVDIQHHRIQSFPDTFRFVVGDEDPSRAALTKWIGDAVPPLLGYAATLPLFARL